ncbi:predicted protein [Botrytis cinerea T4]|uniref:Uncharacterized protein n=1 Tax=Botryotinia fuckeliana (strain T4) TaxID=999810 RepID=G2Y891_BOTF4|nr:predicted protein [Botrytis cinerea T4]
MVLAVQNYSYSRRNTDSPRLGAAAITTALTARLAITMADYDIQIQKYDD